MRLIDADKYIDIWEECGWLDDITVKEFNEMTPTIQAIPLEQVKQLREKIKDMQSHIQLKDKTTNEHWIFVDKFDVLEILDRLISESEGEE